MARPSVLAGAALVVAALAPDATTAQQPQGAAPAAGASVVAQAAPVTGPRGS